MTARIDLRPGVISRKLWGPVRPGNWKSIRKIVLERDDFTCQACGHRALKFMNVHHLRSSDDNSLGNLASLCVACHAILHLGRSMSVGVLEVYRARVTQVEIVQRTRAGIRSGLSLAAINKGFGLARGQYLPQSIEYANDLLHTMRSKPRACLPKPLCAVFVRFNRWQIED